MQRFGRAMCRAMCLGAVAALGAGGVACAQYYPPTPYPGPPVPYYGPTPAPETPRYSRPGFHCDAVFPFSQRRMICTLAEGRPVGENCICPPPVPIPGNPAGSFARGRVIP